MSTQALMAGVLHAPLILSGFRVTVVEVDTLHERIGFSVVFFVPQCWILLASRKPASARQSCNGVSRTEGVDILHVESPDRIRTLSSGLPLVQSRGPDSTYFDCPNAFHVLLLEVTNIHDEVPWALEPWRGFALGPVGDYNPDVALVSEPGP